MGKQSVNKTVEKAHNHPASHRETGFLPGIRNFYIHEYKKILLIPFILFFIAAAILATNYFRTGELFAKDVSLSGGISVTIYTDKQINIDQVQSALDSSLKSSSVNVRLLQVAGKSSGIIIEDSKPQDETQIISIMRQQLGPFSDKDYSVETMGSSLGSSFFREMFLALFFAFLCMGIVFFIYFRALIPTAAAVISAFFDLFITMGIIVLFGMRLTSGGIAAFLMIIGYSIDTSILLTTKVQNSRKDEHESAIFGAMKTGLTMSAAGLLATAISFLFTNNETLKQIMLILVIGLMVDLITTWIENVGLLRLYLERKDRNVKA